jgi:hypothetical protein
MTRYAARIDSNQAEIMDALRSLGVWCVDMHWCGRGVPDILAVDLAGTFWVEAKGAHGLITPSEREWARKYPGDLYVVRCVEDVVELVNKRREARA